ncbi:coniferyl aldehyde dehydrogenase [Variovorax saccharolyticus]|uniref:coniferyl aldehyde dehydrogenase n=1 Tax=Variovorax saccharolyticus TaxID=3053516 RepID=UPI00257705D1|nr:coniferyl aldehyde dehydrogenase [Variovorax sp. J31P216]MDM0027418.1 coniferyl aldehyde dehydrogenase [Variovorax sp. J31P216]
MTHTLDAPRAEPVDRAQQRVAQLFAAQQAAFAAAPWPDADQRRERLRSLKKQVSRYQDLLAEAMSHDFGYRSEAESKMLDLLGSMLELDHAIRHVRRWMKPSRRSTELLFISNSIRVEYQPKGVVGVIVPWNFPVYLALGPLVAALAAGNRVMVKMPEVTPATNAVLKRMLAEVFAEDLVAVVGEELLDPNAFTSLPFDHIVFTGSPAVGRIVMRTAAENLTPVTLELGGKSPALVTRNYPVADAARRITHGKSTNCGQICVSPDYALVPREHVAEFVEAVGRTFKKFYAGKTVGNADYTAIVNERQYQRLRGLLDDARAKGATVASCAPMPTGEGRQMPLQILTGLTPDMRVMSEELFGPILPVVPYDTMDEAIAFINARPRPLALYCFSHDAGERDALLRRTHSGGVAINDWGWQVVNHDAPFGGIGNSGMGTYHGVEGFRELSHGKTVFKRQRLFPIDLFYPPYGSFVQRLALRFFVGRADAGLAARTTPSEHQA